MATDADFLLGYSEWLDQQKLIVAEHPLDDRSHEDLVRDFLEEHHRGD